MSATKSTGSSPLLSKKRKPMGELSSGAYAPYSQHYGQPPYANQPPPHGYGGYPQHQQHFVPNGNPNWQGGPPQSNPANFGANQPWSSQQQMSCPPNPSAGNASPTPDRQNWAPTGDGYRPTNGSSHHSPGRTASSSPVNSSNTNPNGPIGWHQQSWQNPSQPRQQTHVPSQPYVHPGQSQAWNSSASPPNSRDWGSSGSRPARSSPASGGRDNRSIQHGRSPTGPMRMENVGSNNNNMNDDGFDPLNSTYCKIAENEDASSRDKMRGSYRCGKCGVPKKGHICPYQPKFKRRPDEPLPETRNASTQVEMDEFLVLRRLNLEIQGFPETYTSEPVGNVGTEVHPRRDNSVSSPNGIPIASSMNSQMSGRATHEMVIVGSNTGNQQMNHVGIGPSSVSPLSGQMQGMPPMGMNMDGRPSPSSAEGSLQHSRRRSIKNINRMDSVSSNNVRSPSA